MKRTTILLSALALSFGAFGATAPNMKYFKKAAEKVWAMNLPDFNAKKYIPDSVSKSESAVIIAALDKVDDDLSRNPNGTISTTNRITSTTISRRMVKILDRNALDNYSSFEFDAESAVKVNNQPIKETKPAFGARIYKADGTVRDVDINDYVAVTTDKNAKDADSYKIAISGLEVGDVIDYFYYSEMWCNEKSPKPITFSMANTYPTLTYLVDGSFHEDLTVEYHTYNGAPYFECSTDKNKNTISLKMTNLPARERGIGLLPMRQFPFIKLYVTNRTARLEYHPSTTRLPGIHANPATGTIYRDIFTTLRAATYESRLPGKTVKAVNQFIKEHPDADQSTIVDAAWMALIYYNTIDEDNSVESETDFWLMYMFPEVLKKLKIDADVSYAFINDRNDVPTDQIVSWGQPDYMCAINNELYSTKLRHNTPREELPLYQNEQGALYPSNVKDWPSMTMPQLFTVPPTRPTQNRCIINSEVTINSDELSIDRSVELTGGIKDMYVHDAYTSADWVRDVEAFLNIPENKRVASTMSDAQDRQKAIEKAINENIVPVKDATPTINSFKLLSPGVIPGSPSFKYEENMTVSGLISDAGNDLVINIGKLFGDQHELSDEERSNRVNAYCIDCPHQSIHTLHVKLPDGYTVKEGSLDSLAANVATQFGQFFAQATYDEDTNTVTVITQEKALQYFMSPESWPAVTAIYDASAHFNHTSLLLTKK
jgi:hypothetical protein